MLPNVRLFGPDRVEIVDLPSWLAHAPPEKGLVQWKDGFSAKEQAKAWLRPGRPAAPQELWDGLDDLTADVEEIYARPEHTTRLDDFARKRQHDLFACARKRGVTKVVIGVEAKACEGFDGTVGDRAPAGHPSNKRSRCNLLSRALFGRDVIDQTTGDILDPELARHGYQLWTAAVGTLIEAQTRNIGEVVLIVHQFMPSDPDAARRAGDTRDWRTALASNQHSFDTFVSTLAAAGARSHKTEFVRPGTKLKVIKVQSLID